MYCNELGIEIVYLLFIMIYIKGSLCIFVKFKFLWKLFWFELFLLIVVVVIFFLLFIFRVKVVLIVWGIWVVIGEFCDKIFLVLLLKCDGICFLLELILFFFLNVDKNVLYVEIFI